MQKDPEAKVLEKIFGAMTKRPDQLLGLTKGLAYKGFSDWKQARSIFSQNQQKNLIEPIRPPVMQNLESQDRLK
jgi:hypothetical protein